MDVAKCEAQKDSLVLGAPQPPWRLVGSHPRLLSGVSTKVHIACKTQTPCMPTSTRTTASSMNTKHLHLSNTIKLRLCRRLRPVLLHNEQEASSASLLLWRSPNIGRVLISHLLGASPACPRKTFVILIKLGLLPCELLKVFPVHPPQPLFCGENSKLFFSTREGQSSFS